MDRNTFFQPFFSDFQAVLPTVKRAPTYFILATKQWREGWYNLLKLGHHYNISARQTAYIRLTIMFDNRDKYKIKQNNTILTKPWQMAMAEWQWWHLMINFYGKTYNIWLERWFDLAGFELFPIDRIEESLVPDWSLRTSGHAQAVFWLPLQKLWNKTSSRLETQYWAIYSSANSLISHALPITIPCKKQSSEYI